MDIDPEEILPGKYEIVADPDLASHGILLDFSWSDTDSMFDDTDRFPSEDDVWKYITDRFDWDIVEFFGIMDNQLPDARMGIRVLVWEPEDIPKVGQRLREIILGRQEWHGEESLNSEIEEMLL